MKSKAGAAICYRHRSPGASSALQAWVGKLAEPKMPALSIVPDGDILEAELLVPARAIGFVSSGQTVHISYDTFPLQQFSFAHDNVGTVSRTLLKPDEIVGPMLLREPSYRVAVALEHQTIQAYGAELPLEPDLQLEADILFDRRTLLAWILDPLLSAWEQIVMPIPAILGGFGRLPEIGQAAASECGLACLAMVASYYGRQSDLNSLRREYPVSLKGATLGMVMETASKPGLAGRPLRLEIEHLRSLRVPAILHWDMNHFVVLRQVGRSGDDPRSCPRGPPVQVREVSKHFTGVALELTPDETMLIRLTPKDPIS
jgi:hypothetical protein